jgi:hypothetical protein
MTQRTYFSPEGTPRDSAATEIPHNAGSMTLRVNGASGYAVGTPEHSALVDAVKREFPEVFAPQANSGNAQCS